MKNRILAKIYKDLKKTAKSKAISFDIELTFISKKFNLSKTEIFPLSELSNIQLSELIDKLLNCAALRPEEGIFLSGYSEKTIRRHLDNVGQFKVETLPNENIGDIFDNVDNIPKDATDDIYVYGKIVKNSIKIEDDNFEPKETFFTKVTFDVNVIYDGGDIKKTEQYTLSEFLADYESYGYDICKQLSDETYVRVTIDNETDGALIFWRNPKDTASKETIQKEVLRKLKNEEDMLVNVLYDTDILDVFDDGDVETDNEEYQRILDGDSDYTEELDISVYVHIIPDSIKFL